MHEGGFRVEGLAPDRLRFYTPEAKLLPQTPPLPPLPAADPLDTLRAQQAELAITAATPATWRGERMDYSWAIDSLLRRDDLIDSLLDIDSSAGSRADSYPDSAPTATRQIRPRTSRPSPPPGSADPARAALQRGPSMRVNDALGRLDDSLAPPPNGFEDQQLAVGEAPPAGGD